VHHLGVLPLGRVRAVLLCSSPQKHQQVKIIYNDVLKSSNADGCSIINPLHEKGK
jgi:hypothetical protein